MSIAVTFMDQTTLLELYWIEFPQKKRSHNGEVLHTFSVRFGPLDEQSVHPTGNH